MTGLKEAKSIDVHAHAVLDMAMGAAGEHGPELTEEPGKPAVFRVGGYTLHGVKYRQSPFMDPDRRIAAMDKAGIDFQVISPNPLTYFHYIDVPNAVRFNQKYNEGLQDLSVRYPDRLAGFAGLPMQDVGAAVEELYRGVQELGLLGGYIGTDFGMPLDDPEMDRLYEACVKLNVPLFIHPAPAGIDGPAGDPHLDRYDMALTTGFAASETIAVGSLIFGEVLERHPDIDICLSHGGGAAMFLLGRMAQASRVRPWAPASLSAEGAYEEILGKLWFDTNVHEPRSLQLMRDIVGDEKLVFGTNFAGWDQADPHLPDGFMDVLTANAKRLLRA